MFKIDEVIGILAEEFKKYPLPMGEKIFYESNDTFKLLVSTILSARTKDETTMKILPRLFSKVSTPDALRKLNVLEIERLIYPVGFYKNKAKFLKELPDALDRFSGKVPKNLEELITLPGVGRKTANLVLSVGFNIPAICVDIHVHRISNRLGYIISKNPLETEQKLMKKLPKKYWTKYNAYLVSHGQNTCSPINPFCSRCPVKIYCKQFGIINPR
jgi:endonuclease III